MALSESLITSFARKRNMQHYIWVKVPSAVCDGVDLWWHGLHRKASSWWMWKLSKKCHGLQSSKVMLQQIPDGLHPICGVSPAEVGFIPCSEPGSAHLCWLNDEALLIGWDQDRYYGCESLGNVTWNWSLSSFCF